MDRIGRVDQPEVLFVCVHNAGRSQMAAALTHHLSSGTIAVKSGGTQPADEVNPVVIRAMQEIGVDLGTELPKALTDDAVRAADVVITMGCGDECPFDPGKRYEDWAVADPAGQPLDVVRGIRDDIKERVEALVAELAPG
jgi:arsenate reductase